LIFYWFLSFYYTVADMWFAMWNLARDLSDNLLCGDIPFSLSKLKQLDALWVTVFLVSFTVLQWDFCDFYGCSGWVTNVFLVFPLDCGMVWATSEDGNRMFSFVPSDLELLWKDHCMVFHQILGYYENSRKRFVFMECLIKCVRETTFLGLQWFLRETTPNEALEFFRRMTRRENSDHSTVGVFVYVAALLF